MARTKVRTKAAPKAAPKTRGRSTSGREVVARCGADRGAKPACRQFAGAGTDHKGEGLCWLHSAGNRKQDLRGNINTTMRHARAYASQYRIAPDDAILWCIRHVAGEVRFWNEALAELPDGRFVETTMFGRQLCLEARERHRAMEMLVKFSEAAIRSKVAERRVAIAEHIGMTLADLLDGIMSDLKLTDAQREASMPVVQEHLTRAERRQISAGDVEQEEAA